MSWISRFFRAVGPWRLVLSAVVLTLMGFVTTVVPSPIFPPGRVPASWPTADGSKGTHYSVLSDVSVENVTHLQIAWSYRTGDVQAYEKGLAGTAFEELDAVNNSGRASYADNDSHTKTPAATKPRTTKPTTALILKNARSTSDAFRCSRSKSAPIMSSTVAASGPSMTVQ